MIQFHRGGSQISFWGGAVEQQSPGLCPRVWSKGQEMEDCIPPLLNDPLCHTGVDFRGLLFSRRDVILWDSKATITMES